MKKTTTGVVGAIFLAVAITISQNNSNAQAFSEAWAGKDLKIVASEEDMSFMWPSGQKVPILEKFVLGPHDWSPGHRGVDLKLKPGSAVYAAELGDVTFAGIVVDRGVVSIKHSKSLRTTYDSLTPVVRSGQRVKRGQIIGYVQSGHCSGGCLHWGAQRDGEYINPISLIKEEQIRLYK